jgi:DNA-binding GntR family transcriptional regulator
MPTEATRLVHFVLNTLREQIFKNHYKPGERLNEVQLAKQLSTSRSPLREAFQQLASEGLVKIIPRKGAYVVKFEYDEILYLFEVREAIDSAAARLAAERADRFHIQRLIDTLDLTRQLLHTHDHPFYPLDLDFHEKLLDATRNEILIEKGMEVHSQLRLARSRSGYGLVRAQQAFDEHCTILDAIKMRAPNEAELAMQNHLKNVLANLRAILEQETASQEKMDTIAQP